MAGCFTDSPLVMITMNKLLKYLLLPHIIFLVMTALSFICWSIPDFNGSIRKGFNSGVIISSKGLLIAVFWISLVSFTSASGFKIGKFIKFNNKIINERANIDDSRPFKILIFLALVGVAYVYLNVISSLGLAGIISAISGGQANALKEALYVDYSPGLPSLRYIAIPAGALGMYHIIRGKYISLSITSIFLLLLVSIVSSRLSIVYAVFIFLGLVARNRQINISFWKILVGFTVLLHVIFALNYSRNINFYRKIGIDNFYLAGISEVVAYLGSPFQGFLAVSESPGRFSNITEIDTHTRVDISEELTTNSAFLELVREDNIYSAMLRIAWITFISSILMSVSWRNSNNLIILVFGALGYCFAEIWRINLFSQGIVFTIVLGIVLAVIVCLSWPRSKRSSYSKKIILLKYKRRSI